MSVSSKQIQANQQNALKGGIKTQKGKSISKMNALKHGLTSQNIVNKAEKEVYDVIYSTLVNELAPQNFLETILIERIAFYYTKLQRIVKIDTQEVNIQTLFCTMKHLQDTMPENHVFEIDINPDTGVTQKQIQIQEKIEQLQEQIRKLEKGYISSESIDVLAKLQKYETTLENRLYKAIQTYYAMKNKT